MEIKIEGVGDISVLHCDGSLDADSAADFRSLTTKLVDEGSTKLVVDCSGLSFVDSIGLGTLISLLRRVRQEQGDLKLSALTDNVKTVFEITRLYRLFDIFSDWQAAAGKF